MSYDLRHENVERKEVLAKEHSKDVYDAVAASLLGQHAKQKHMTLGSFQGFISNSINEQQR